MRSRGSRLPDAPEVLYAVEGETDVPFVEKLLVAAGATPRRALVAGGKSKLDPRILHWNQRSNRAPMFVVRDWDASDSAACASELHTRLLGGGTNARLLELRIAVRAMESWLLADGTACAGYFGITVPSAAPDSLADPKVALVQACATSRKRNVREAMVPAASSRRRVGPDYEAHVIAFGREHWDVERAVSRSPSLERALRRARELVGRV